MVACDCNQQMLDHQNIKKPSATKDNLSWNGHHWNYNTAHKTNQCAWSFAAGLMQLEKRLD